MARLAILIPEADYRDDWPAQLAGVTTALEAAGHKVAARVWHDAADLTGFDLVLPLFVWGYPDRLDCWSSLLNEWQKAGVQLANPAKMLRWNSDKSYLAQLAARGVDVVPGIEVAALDDAALSAARTTLGVADVVIKPLVSAGAADTFLLEAGEGVPKSVAGQRMLVQPVMAAVRDPGEWSLLYFGGEFSHALIKKPQSGDFRVQEKFGGQEAAMVPPVAAKALASAAIAAAANCTGTGTPLYARADMVTDDAGVYRLMELELVEPSLFLRFASDKGAAFAGAVSCAVAATTTA